MVSKPKIPGYALKGTLGKGGNADVWKATNASGTLVAVKVLRIANAKGDSYPRFQREVREHLQLTNERVAGVLPLLDQYLPPKPSDVDRPWLVTPLATPLKDALGKRPPLETVVAAVARIADTLARLHQRPMAHRDVKPSNCYSYDGGWVLGDFGLIQTPLDAEAALTVGVEALGPRAFIAPEMIHHADTAAVGPADVYSLGKTLWTLATGLSVPPLGEHRLEFDGKRLKAFGVAHPRAFRLDHLIDLMTREVPDERPAMDRVAQELNDWAASPTPRESAELSLDDVAGAIVDIFKADRRVAEQRQSRMALAESIAADIARRMPEILQRLATAGIQHSGLLSDHAGISGALADQLNKTPDIDVAGWRTCKIGGLSFGAAAALSRGGVVALGATYVLRDATGERVLWLDTDTALVASTSYEDKVRRLADGLVSNLQAALNELHKSISQDG
jgi:serine/threonine protein kinase